MVFLARPENIGENNSSRFQGIWGDIEILVYNDFINERISESFVNQKKINLLNQRQDVFSQGNCFESTDRYLYEIYTNRLLKNELTSANPCGF